LGILFNISHIGQNKHPIEAHEARHQSFCSRFGNLLLKRICIVLALNTLQSCWIADRIKVLVPVTAVAPSSPTSLCTTMGLPTTRNVLPYLYFFILCSSIQLTCFLSKSINRCSPYMAVDYYQRSEAPCETAMCRTCDLDVN